MSDARMDAWPDEAAEPSGDGDEGLEGEALLNFYGLSADPRP